MKTTNAENITTICGGQTRTWATREEAANFFFEAIAATEGSECERYINVYVGLLKGLTTCTDR